MRLRPYQPEDFAALYAIEELCFKPPYRFSRRVMRGLIEAGNTATWIADAVEGMAGFAIVEWSHEEKGVVAYIDTLEVAPAFRRRGTGAMLLAQCEHTAQGAGATILWLHVAVENRDAMRLYESHGFAWFMTEEHFYAPGRGAHVYSKPLVSAG